jgi:hypothetical protein
MKRKWLKVLLNPLSPILDRWARFVNLSRTVYFGVLCGLLVIFGIILPSAVDENPAYLKLITLVPLAVVSFSVFMLAGGLVFLTRSALSGKQNAEIKRVVFKRFLYNFFLKLPGLLLLGISLRIYTMGADYTAIVNEVEYPELLLRICLPFGEQAAAVARAPLPALPVLYAYLVFFLSALRIWTFNYEERYGKEKDRLDSLTETRARITDRDSHVTGSGKSRTTVYTVKYEYSSSRGGTRKAACSSGDPGETGYVRYLYHDKSISELDIRFEGHDADKHEILFNRIYGHGKETDPARGEFRRRDIDQAGSYGVWGIWLGLAGLTVIYSSRLWVPVPGLSVIMILAAATALCFSVFSFIHFFAAKGKGL